jgi:hypothetical protein
MTVVSFPADVPFCPANASLEASLQDMRLASVQDVGESTYRRRYSGQFENLSFDVRLTRAQYKALLTWFHGDCGGGSYPFRARDLDDPLQVSEYTWTSPPTRRAHVPNNSIFMVTFSLVRRVAG